MLAPLSVPVVERGGIPELAQPRTRPEATAVPEVLGEEGTPGVREILEIQDQREGLHLPVRLIV